MPSSRILMLSQHRLSFLGEFVTGFFIVKDKATHILLILATMTLSQRLDRVIDIAGQVAFDAGGRLGLAVLRESIVLEVQRLASGHYFLDNLLLLCDSLLHACKIAVSSLDKSAALFLAGEGVYLVLLVQPAACLFSQLFEPGVFGKLYIINYCQILVVVVPGVALLIISFPKVVGDIRAYPLGESHILQTIEEFIDILYATEVNDPF